MSRPNDVFVVKYVQAYIKRFNKTVDFPPGVVESWKSNEDGLEIKIFLPTVTSKHSDSIGSRAVKLIPWDDVMTDATSLGV